MPGHDERDFEFATTFELPMTRVIAAEGEDASSPLAEAYAGDGVLVNSGDFDGLSVDDAKRAVEARPSPGENVVGLPRVTRMLRFLPPRCHRTTVSGFTKCNASRHSFSVRRSMIQNTRSLS